MSRKTEFRGKLPGILKIGAENQALYFWVMALKKIMPSIQLKSAIIMFFDEYGIDENEWPLATAEQMFFRYSKKEMFNKNENP